MAPQDLCTCPCPQGPEVGQGTEGYLEWTLALLAQPVLGLPEGSWGTPLSLACTSPI